MKDEIYKQGSLFSELYEPKIITKPIRLIECFAGIGSQAKALELLGVPFEHHKIVEWAFNSIVAYNHIHMKDFTDYSEGKTKEELVAFLNGNISTDYNEPCDCTKKPLEWLKKAYNNCIATHNLMNIMKVKGNDLEIVDTDKYEYVLTYSFPCQDLSLAGKGKGMSISQAEGGTRSGLLWEIERILDELNNLPQILIMENVPQVVGANNIKDFQKWEAKLTSLGYQNYIEVLNAKDYGIPQNRQRCFMVSILGDYSYEFPIRLRLEKRLKDLLEENVAEKYFLSDKMLEKISNWKGYENPLDDIDPNRICSCITTHCGKDSNSMQLVNSLPIKNATKKGYLLAKVGDGIDISTRMETHRGTVQKGTAQTLTCAGGNNVGVVVKEEPLKRTLCNDLIKKGLVHEGDIVKHSYTTQILKGNKKCVEKSNEMITLTTRGDCVGVVVGMYQYNKSDQFMEGKDRFTKDKEIADTLCTTPKEGVVLLGGVGEKKSNGGTQYYEHERIYDSNALATCLTTGNHPYYSANLRIRKLTPKECMRLMGFEDDDTDNMVKAGLSDSAIYHCAGDSIVSTVLVAIFSQLFDNKNTHIKVINNYLNQRFNKK